MNMISQFKSQKIVRENMSTKIFQSTGLYSDYLFYPTNRAKYEQTLVTSRFSKVNICRFFLSSLILKCKRVILRLLNQTSSLVILYKNISTGCGKFRWTFFFFYTVDLTISLGNNGQILLSFPFIFKLEPENVW